MKILKRPQPHNMAKTNQFSIDYDETKLKYEKKSKQNNMQKINGRDRN